MSEFEPGGLDEQGNDRGKSTMRKGALDAAMPAPVTPAPRAGSSARRKSASRSARSGKQSPAAPSGLTLALAPESRWLKGCGFGIDQPVLLGSVLVRLDDAFDMRTIEPLLEEFAHAGIEDLELPAEQSRELLLVHRMHQWHAAIQRGANVPVFGGCRLAMGDVSAEGVHEIRFVVPCFDVKATLATLRFMIDTVAELAQEGANSEAALSRARKRFDALWSVLESVAVTGVNTKHFLAAAHRLGIEHQGVFGRLRVFGMGCHRKLLNSSLSSSESHIGVGLVRDKLASTAMLRMTGLPVAQNGEAKTVEGAVRLAAMLGYPVVVKPIDSDGGMGVTAGIEDEADLRRAFEMAREVSQRVMVEKHQHGSDYRVTVVQGRAVKVMVRQAAGVVGDGTHTIAQLVDKFNDATRGIVLRNQRAPLAIDEEAQTLLGRLGYAGDTVLPDGEYVQLRRRANVSAGGTFDVLSPDAIHADNRLLAENAALTAGLEIAGVDLITGDPTKSWHETGGIVCEVNSSPQIGLRDSETVYDEILTAILGGDGSIPVHLVVIQTGAEMPDSIPALAASMRCNAAAWGDQGWIEQGGALGPFADVFRAAKGILFNPRATGALIVMTEQEVLQHGLPAAHFTSIVRVGEGNWQLGQLIKGHSPELRRRRTAQ